jgi:hypothetical protein
MDIVYKPVVEALQNSVQMKAIKHPNYMYNNAPYAEKVVQDEYRAVTEEELIIILTNLVCWVSSCCHCGFQSR